MILALWLASASAHPLSRELFSFRTALRLDGDRLDALVVLEIPFDVVMAGLRERLGTDKPALDDPASRAAVDAWNQRIWEKMADGLLLVADGQIVPGRWKPSGSRYNGQGAVTEGFFLYVVEFEAAAPLPESTSHTVRVTNIGWPDAPMAWSGVVFPGAGWTVTQSSTTGILPDRPYALDDAAFWVADPSLRTVEGRWTRAVP